MGGPTRHCWRGRSCKRPVCRRCWMGEWDLRGSLPCKLEAHKPRGCRSGKGAVRGRQEGQGRPEDTMETKFPSSFGILEIRMLEKNQRASNVLSSTLCLSSKYLQPLFSHLRGAVRWVEPGQRWGDGRQEAWTSVGPSLSALPT